MKILKEGGQEYAAGIDKALRRAAQQAKLTAAATGTRLVVYEKGRIRRVRPTAKLSSIKKMLRDMRIGLARHPKDFLHVKLKELQLVRKNSKVRRAEGKHSAIAENREKYSSR